ncbi:extracellular solute-binding protein [Saccharibacillus sp. CPCC 101409]|uniref:extracellular solute-binding protein n=1 Tax=Saccharibacillus sp. CPCC 101409 TaxID=3058041 RepID=UPI002673E56B|nr:extracellular solute-binding protein [Saccharibacillus sp. CPCC 101409]MDO3411872.1 extracellular solute-binding protein [Saccharibacillus sp. CPCC 101409]
MRRIITRTGTANGFSTFGPGTRYAKLLAPLLAFALMLSACGGSNQASSEASGGDSGPLEVSVMTITPSATPASDDNVIKRAIEKATNSKLNIQWVSNNIYADKLNLTLASGDIPELIMINDPFSSTFTKMVNQGAFWDISPYIHDYPNLTNGIPEIAWETTKQADGGSYGIPRPRPVDDISFFIIRKDWLDNLGLEPPTTTDELYTVMKAFVEDDPDGDGKKDTTALASYISPDDFNIGPALNAIENSFTGANGSWKWDESQQKLIYTAFLPETRESLEYLAKAYKEGLLPEDLLSLKLTQARELFTRGEAGIIVDKTGTMRNIYADELKKVDPSFKYTDFYPLTAINDYTPLGSGYNGILAIPKTVSEDKLKRILKLVDTWMNHDVFEIQKYGLEGVHYKLENGKKIADKEKLSADNASDFNHIVNVIDMPWEPTGESEEETQANELFKKIDEARAATSVADLSSGLQSAAGQKILPDLNKRTQDIKAKIILGLEPIEAWDEFVSSLESSADVQKMSEEINEAYQVRNAE